MAGYSGTPLVNKLGVKAGHRLVLVSAPPDLDARLAPLPPDVTVDRAAPGEAIAGAWDVALLFCAWSAELDAAWPAARAGMRPAGGLWVCWPKKAARAPGDLTEDVVRAFGLAAGLVDNKVCAVDERWSALRLVVRLRDRP